MILIVVFNVFFGFLFFGRSQDQASQTTSISPSATDRTLGIVTSDVDRAKLAEPEAEPPVEEPAPFPEPVPGTQKVEITTEPIYLPTEANPDTTQPRKPEIGPSEEFTPMVKKPKPEARVERRPKPVARAPERATPKPVRRQRVARVHRPHPVKVARRARPEQFMDLMTDRFDGSNNFEGINNRFGRNN